MSNYISEKYIEELAITPMSIVSLIINTGIDVLLFRAIGVNSTNKLLKELEDEYESSNSRRKIEIEYHIKLLKEDLDNRKNPIQFIKDVFIYGGYGLLKTVLLSGVSVLDTAVLKTNVLKK